MGGKLPQRVTRAKPMIYLKCHAEQPKGARGELGKVPKADCVLSPLQSARPWGRRLAEGLGPLS